METANIKILPDFVANQIAAGEVVQRPESVIKELVENSMDARADSIAVIVKEAGKKLIHVVDNGSGMGKEDLVLSVKRHATSKVYTSEDLEKIITYGFRGEALASIASVASLEIRTKQKNSEHGWSLIADPTKNPEIQACSMDFGTQIFVKNLFYNVPARRKFLRTNLTEFRHISDTMTKFALSRPDIRFTFYDDNNLVFDVKQESPEKRIENLFGKSTAEALIKIQSDDTYYKIRGFIGNPTIAKKSKVGQFFYLNNRSIQSKSLNHAVFSAYDYLIEKDVHPFFVIFLDIDPQKVDVNVHPQKHEVKFDDERYVYRLLNSAVQKALQRAHFIPQFLASDTEEKTNINFTIDRDPGFSSEENYLVNKNTGEIIDTSTFDGKNTGSGKSRYSAAYSKKSISPKEMAAFEELFGDSDKEAQYEMKDYELRQFLNKFIVVFMTDRILIIDQHNAHSRILFNKAVANYSRNSSPSQQILFPPQIKLSSSEMSVLYELKNEINKLGFRLTILKDNEIELTAVPAEFTAGDEINLFKNILDSYLKDEYHAFDDNPRKLAFYYSINAAVKAGKKLSSKEMTALVDELFETKDYAFAPSGHPVFTELNDILLSKQFRNKITRS